MIYGSARGAIYLYLYRPRIAQVGQANKCRQSWTRDSWVAKKPAKNFVRSTGVTQANTEASYQCSLYKGWW